MNRSVPGTANVEGRKFIYVQTDSEFTELLHIVFSSSNPPPNSGGVLDEKVTIVADGDSFRGVSYKGDLDGWQRALRGYCNQNEKRYGIVEGTTLILSDGATIRLEDCEIRFND